MSYKPTPNCIDYVEIGVHDIQSSRHFFEQLFGWKFTDYGPDYVAFDDGRLNGGFYQLPKDKEVSGGSVLVVFYTDDIQAAQQKCEELGATISKPVFEFPGGRRFQFIGPDQIEYSVWTQ